MLPSVTLTGGNGINISTTGEFTFNATEVGLNDVVTSGALATGLAT